MLVHDRWTIHIPHATRSIQGKDLEKHENFIACLEKRPYFPCHSCYSKAHPLWRTGTLPNMEGTFQER